MTYKVSAFKDGRWRKVTIPDTWSFDKAKRELIKVGYGAVVNLHVGRMNDVKFDVRRVENV